MSSYTIELNIDAMPVGQRIELLGQLWNSLDPEAHNIPLTAEQSAEVARRLAKLDAGESVLSPWSDVRQRLMDR